MNEEILNHRESIADLYPVFMRTQIVKREWPRKDEKFTILDDLAESEIIITNCKRVIDFARCSYSISEQDQSRIHLIIETNDETPVHQLV